MVNNEFLINDELANFETTKFRKLGYLKLTRNSEFIKSKLVFVFLVLVFSFCAKNVFSAELFFETTQSSISVNRELELFLFLDTEKESINAVEGRISYPENLIVKEIRDGGSIITLWIKKPSQSINQISFAGITPGGFVSERGKIFSVIFEPVDTGEINIFPSQARALLNDGYGTQALLKLNSFKLKILGGKEEGVSVGVPALLVDKEPPNPFQPKIASDPNIFDGKKFLIFVAQDKQSGIDHFEVKEVKFSLLRGLEKWISAESPYLLQDQNLESYIYVKAIDRAGNSQVASLPPETVYWYMNYWLWIIIIVCCLLAVGYFRYQSRWR